MTKDSPPQERPFSRQKRVTLAWLGALITAITTATSLEYLKESSPTSNAELKTGSNNDKSSINSDISTVESLFNSIFPTQTELAPESDQTNPRMDTGDWVTGDHPLALELRHRPPQFSEVLGLDDACLYHRLETPHSAWRDYFSSTPFGRDYAEYEDVISGFESASSKFGSFYLGLALAHWLDQGERTSPYKRSYARAGRLLLSLAREDRGNAAPAAWALLALEEAIKENDPTMGISISELEEAKDYLTLATRFDSYSLDHLRKMAAIDDSRVVSFLVRVEYHRQLAVPKWLEFLNRLKTSSNVSLETRVRLAELIANNAKNASQPSTAYGYSPFELKFAEKLAENARSIPTAEDIDKSFPVHQLASSVEIVKRQDGPCAPPAKDPYRQSLLKHRQLLKEAGVELGLSL
jgi:hypothetical protein